MHDPGFLLPGSLTKLLIISSQYIIGWFGSCLGFFKGENSVGIMWWLFC